MNFKQRISTPPARSSQPAVQPFFIPNVGVTISHARRQVRIRDLDRQRRDILVQGEDMQQFLAELKSASKTMPDIPVKDALVILTATHVANNWS